KDELTVYLSNFDCLVIGDVPAESFTQTQHESIRSNTYDQGCGLVFVGGPDSYGAGGYQETPIEAALPVDREIKAIKAAGRGGLAVRHTIVSSDGDPQLNAVGKRALADMQRAGVTCSAVGVATHSAAEDTKMTEMAEGAARGGKYYKVKDPKDLPAIYMRES